MPGYTWIISYLSRFFWFQDPRTCETNQNDSWFMSFQGYVAHFGSVIWEKNKSRPRPRTKQAKQAKHISQMGRRHRNHTRGRGMFAWRCFLKQLIGPPNTKELVFKLQLIETIYSRSEEFLFWGDGLWFEIHIRLAATTKCDQKCFV